MTDIVKLLRRYSTAGSENHQILMFEAADLIEEQANKLNLAREALEFYSKPELVTIGESTTETWTCFDYGDRARKALEEMK